MLTRSAVEETVSSLDGVVDDIGGDRVVDLPETETDLGHVIAAVELDNGSHCFCVFLRPWATFAGALEKLATCNANLRSRNLPQGISRRSLWSASFLEQCKAATHSFRVHALGIS